MDPISAAFIKESSKLKTRLHVLAGGGGWGVGRELLRFVPSLRTCKTQVWGLPSHFHSTLLLVGQKTDGT